MISGIEPQTIDLADLNRPITPRVYQRPRAMIDFSKMNYRAK